jgi:NADPH:quinone reductase-like Zn-dependent oxidoreductase
MKAAVVHDFSQPPRFADFAEPEAGPGDRLIRVRAAALSQLVRAQAAGRHYSSGSVPLVPGVDGVGQLEDGSRVYFAFPRAPFGAMADLTAVPADNCIPVPDDVDDVTAAAIANPGMSSWAALTERAHLQRGECVLVNGATGASGRLAIQIARHLGAGTIIATGRSMERMAGLKDIGADVLLPLDQPPDALKKACHETIHGHTVNVILDYLWGPPAECLLAAISGHGGREAEPRIRYVQIGSSAGPVINFPGAILRSSGLELMGSGLGSISHGGLLRAVAGVFDAVAPAKLAIATDAVPLQQVESAWTATSSDRLVFTLSQ